MAEIKVYNPQLVTNRPIGVVTPSSAGVKAAEAQARLFGNLSNIFYKKAEESEQKKGVEFAKNVRTLDEEQNVVVTSVPDSFSKIATDAAEPIIQQRITASFAQSLKSKARTYRTQTEDPEEFSRLFTGYINQQAKLNPEYENVIKDLGGALGEDNYTDLFIKQTKKQEDFDYNTQVTNLNEMISELGAEIVIASDETLATKMAFTTKIEEAIEDVAKRFPEKVSPTFVSTMKSQLELERNTALTNRYISNMDSFLEGKTQQQSDLLKLSSLNYLSIALNTGKFPKMPNEVKELLTNVGFNEDFFNRTNLSRTNANNIASTVRVTQGTLSEIATQRADENLFTLQNQFLDAGGNLDKSQSKDFLDYAGITSTFKVIQTLEQHFAFNEETGGLSGNPDSPVFKIFSSNSELPKQLSGLFTPEAISEIASQKPAFLGFMIDIYNQGTRTYYTDDSGKLQQVFQNRGLSDEQHIFMQTLSAYRSSVKAEDFDSFISKYTNLERLTKEDKENRLRTALKVKEGESINKAYDKFLDKNMKGKDFEQKEFIRLYADEILLMHGPEITEEVIEQTSDLFRESKYMRGKSRYAPEINFSNEMNIFDQSIKSKLASINREDLEIGKNVFLVADERLGDVYPQYFMVDENGGALLSENGEFLKITTDEILLARISESNKSIAQLTAEAIERLNYLRSGQYEKDVIKEQEKRKSMEIITPSINQPLTEEQQFEIELRRSTGIPNV